MIETNDETMLETAIKNGIVIKNGAWYNMVNSEGAKTLSLGKSKDEAIKKLNELTTSADNIPTTQEATIEYYQEDYSAVLDSLIDLKPELTGSNDFAVFINGIDTRQDDHRAIKNTPLVFIWNLKKIMPDGKYQSAKGARVYTKGTIKGLTTLRDDTPNETYISIGDNVLCVVKKDQWNKMRKERLLKLEKKDLMEQEGAIQTSTMLGKATELEQVQDLLNVANVSDRIKEINSEIEKL